jgi:hypothetical protein
VAVDDETYLVGFFRLFGQNDTPSYQVVVGRRRDRVTADDLRHIHPDGLSALAVNQEKVRALLDGLESA